MLVPGLTLSYTHTHTHTHTHIYIYIYIYIYINTYIYTLLPLSVCIAFLQGPRRSYKESTHNRQELSKRVYEGLSLFSYLYFSKDRPDKGFCKDTILFLFWH